MEARDLADHRGNAQLLDMLAFIEIERYGQLRSAFAELSPIYRERLGPPPWSREQDCAVEPEPLCWP